MCMCGICTCVCICMSLCTCGEQRCPALSLSTLFLWQNPFHWAWSWAGRQQALVSSFLYPSPNITGVITQSYLDSICSNGSDRCSSACAVSALIRSHLPSPHFTLWGRLHMIWAETRNIHLAGGLNMTIWDGFQGIWGQLECGHSPGMGVAAMTWEQQQKWTLACLSLNLFSLSTNSQSSKYWIVHSCLQGV